MPNSSSSSSNKPTHDLPLVVASTSRYRRELLERLGVPFEAHAHKVDEEAIKSRGMTPAEVAVKLARMKAESLAADFPGRVILGSDQVAEIDGEILDKPGTSERAVAQLEELSGRKHRLITAVAVRLPDGSVLKAVDTHVMTMRVRSRRQLQDYVARDSPLDCCGSYRIESLGIALFSSIEGEDFTAIMGLPMIAVTGMLERAGFKVLG